MLVADNIHRNVGTAVVIESTAQEDLVGLIVIQVNLVVVSTV